MPKSAVFRINEGRIFFKCPFCKHRRMIGVGAGPRRRTIRCQKCGQKTVGVLNRRQMDRTNQGGRVVLWMGGNQYEVDLFDISPRGVGFEVDGRFGIKIEVGRDIELRCSWNPLLFKQGRYIVKSVRGQRVGAERRG